MTTWALLPQGECWITRVGDDLRIDRADPRILISEELVQEWRQDLDLGRPLHPAMSLEGDLLRIRAINRTVIYRLVEHVPEYRVWIAEWPD